MKNSFSRLAFILFPEMEKLVPTLHMASVYALLSEFPSASGIASVHLTRLTHLLSESSKGRCRKDTAAMRETARTSSGSRMPAKFLELKHIIKIIRELGAQIEENEIKIIMDEINYPILTIPTIPGISYCMGEMIIVEIGDFNRFDLPDKILAHAGMSRSTYQLE